MNAFILGLATAVPPCAYDQNEVVEKFIQIFSIDLEKSEKLRKVYRNTAINKRHVITSDFKKERKDWDFWGCDYPKTIPGMTKRNDIYKNEAPKLAHESSLKALKAWGGDPAAITHVISVSCTGMFTPGIEFGLVNSLGLKRSTHRLGINFMGCFGAFKGLAVARAFAKESPTHRILLVCTELCSLHLQADLSGDTLVSNALFADGAAAAIIGSEPQPGENPMWSIANYHSFGLEDSLEHMSWEAGDHGFFMKLSPFVPLVIGQYIQPFVDTLMGSYTVPSACDWPIHPGGKAILHAVEKALKLNKSQTLASWETLANYGNMSSATFLFVLEELYRQKNQQPWAAGLGFGPGLSIEGILLRQP